jgi:hypothetical protein
MFDSDVKSAFCNRRYVEMCELSADLGHAGCAHFDHLIGLLQTRTLSGNPNEYIAELMAKIAEGNTFTQSHHLG